MKGWGKIILALLPAIILLGIGIRESGGKGRLPFTEAAIKKEHRKIEDLQGNILKGQEQQRKLVQELREMKVFRDTGNAVPVEKIGPACRERIENTANAAGFKMNSMSDIRRVDVTEEISMHELSIGGDCQVEELVGLMRGFEQQSPRVYWRSLSIKPNNIVKPDKLALNGVIAILNFSPDKSEEKE